MLRLICLLILLPGFVLADPSFWKNEFPKTDFSQRTIDSWGEILSGGPPRDGIPALMDPDMVPVADADLPGREPVMTLELDGETPRAYPLRYMIWHEIVNDRVGDVPVAVTFCPLCNSALTFDRRHDGQVLTFGVTGKLRASDMVMYDRETESWWQQAMGEGIVGEYAGDSLTTLPSWMEAWQVFAERNPDGLVMAEPDYPRNYGMNPYAGYDSRERPYPFFTGETPPHDIPALARVVRVGERAWPMERLSDGAEITEAGVTLTWEHEQASALGGSVIGEAASVGAIRVRDGDGNDLPHDVMFAFAFHAFYPDGEWMLSARD
ncbi:DUF3179 domain-containing protein [Maritimibacter sp. UBA3975]|uniref:DUF3179 domain-containing protein n=1 Tax=Maritimibacter sp. UBA3975 TaxID=1946833 RepID=UPI000C0AC7AE|nr:DUF3179 domain-containing protein [Maritimibacter sp. UBA3975]MAM61081.1 hypothetical protein [Maritimibacter sp.]|tara:strand:- start:1756 stop:2721 length:966 start_codon:yes stop_codon:yes gene_type:complete